MKSRLVPQADRFPSVDAPPPVERVRVPQSTDSMTAVGSRSFGTGTRTPPPWPIPALRLHVRTLVGEMCEWPGCHRRGIQLAHLRHRGMGGAPSANQPDNVVWLCVHHHNLFDGRLQPVPLDELHDLFTVTCQPNGIGCVWPTCHNPTVTPDELCELHAAVLRRPHGLAHWRTEVGYLLKVIALRREAAF